MKERVLKTEEDFEKWRDDCLCNSDVAETPKEYPCLAKTYVSDWGMEEETADYLYKSDLLEILRDFDT